MFEKKAKSFSTFDFSISCTTVPHIHLIKVLSEVISFILKSKVKKRIGISEASNMVDF